MESYLKLHVVEVSRCKRAYDSVCFDIKVDSFEDNKQLYIDKCRRRAFLKKQIDKHNRQIKKIIGEINVNSWQEA